MVEFASDISGGVSGEKNRSSILALALVRTNSKPDINNTRRVCLQPGNKLLTIRYCKVKQASQAFIVIDETLFISNEQEV